MSRIWQIPRVDYRLTAEASARYWTSVCRTEYGSEVLRPIQGAALSACYYYGGLAGFMRVGCGKSHVSGLIPYAVGAKRALVVVPGSLLEETESKFERLRLHWRIPNNIRIESYQKIGHPKHRDLLKNYRPDWVIADEAHFLANVTGAAVAIRFAELMHQFPETRLAWMTGSGFGKSLLEIGHLILWALKEGAPVPETRDLLALWADCLDVGIEDNPRRQRGDLRILAPHLGPAATVSVEHAQAAFGSRLFFTPGVIVSRDAFVDSGLEIRPHYLPSDAKIEEAYYNLRKTWTLPDGWILPEDSGAFGVYRTARQLKLGFYYRHDPRPPEDWLLARRRHFSDVRWLILEGYFDSFALACNAISRGEIPWAEKHWRDWHAIKDQFVPNTVVEWISKEPLNSIYKWGKHGGAIFTNHTEFGLALAKVSGWRYFADEGRDLTGMHLDDCRDRTIVVSSQANSEGRNMQQWSRAYFCEMPSGPKKAEQKLGRLHREGQKADVVEYHYSVGCLEDVQAISRAHTAAIAVKRQSFEQEQKLCQATILWPDPSMLNGYAYMTSKQLTKERIKNVA